MALMIRKAQNSEYKQSKVGVRVTARRDVRRKEHFSSDDDDGADHLHRARFLAPPSGDNMKWAKKVPNRRKRVFAPQWQEDLGVEHKFTESVWTALHDRRVRLDFNNFVSSNYDADKKTEAKSKDNAASNVAGGKKNVTSKELETRIDTCCPKSMMGRQFYNKYLRINNIDESKLERKYCGEAVYAKV